MKSFRHTRDILLIEDRLDNYRPIKRWLEREDCQVTIATTLEEALHLLDSQHFHLAIVDIRLDDSDENNEDGLVFLEEVAKRELSDILPRIVLTNYSNEARIYRALQLYRASHYVRKDSEFRDRLSECVKQVFDDQIKIGFDLIYEGIADSFFSNLAESIRWENSPRPATSILVSELFDLFGRLFYKAKRIYLTPMKPGLTGAVVVRVRPSWSLGTGPSYILKFSRREKVKSEEERYTNYVDPYVPISRIELAKTAYTRHLGVLQYTFAGGDLLRLQEFDAYYLEKEPLVTVDSLRTLFETTCHNWYRHRDNYFSFLPDLYWQAFDLDQRKLVDRIQEAEPPFDPLQEQYELAEFPFSIVNPLPWLERNRETLTMEVFYCITHGDLTGRNIMVSEDGKFWLIDFFRTYPSHILRDFVILETDIKYRLMPELEVFDFIALEEYLLQWPGSTATVDLADLVPPARKAAIVIDGLRQLGRDYAHQPGGQPEEEYQEYWLSLLMTTLNVVRLRHIAASRKRQALFSAGLICSRLDDLLGGR